MSAFQHLCAGDMSRRTDDAAGSDGGARHELHRVVGHDVGRRQVTVVQPPCVHMPREALTQGNQGPLSSRNPQSVRRDYPNGTSGVTENECGTARVVESVFVLVLQAWLRRRGEAEPRLVLRIHAVLLDHLEGAVLHAIHPNSASARRTTSLLSNWQPL
jgi:hypothetical protein